MPHLRPLAATLALLLGASLLDGCATAKLSAAHGTHKRARHAHERALARGDEVGDPAADEAGDRLQDALERGELELTDAVDEGLVSWYHDSLAGNPTANGERYRLAGATCAHKTLPFGTIVVIEDTETGRLATCRVNDRGPYVKGRVLDVSKRVARDLGLLERGVIRARLRLILPKTA